MSLCVLCRGLPKQVCCGWQRWERIKCRNWTFHHRFLKHLSFLSPTHLLIISPPSCHTSCCSCGFLFILFCASRAFLWRIIKMKHCLALAVMLKGRKTLDKGHINLSSFLLFPSLVVLWQVCKSGGEMIKHKLTCLATTLKSIDG